MREGSRETCTLLSKSAKPQNETIINRADPTHTSICVRSPATQLRRSRSMPTILPNTAATTSRRIIWCSGSMDLSPRRHRIDGVLCLEKGAKMAEYATSRRDYPHQFSCQVRDAQRLK